MKILIAGAGGMLGKDLAAELENAHELIKTDVGELDITDLRSVMNFTVKTRPDMIINAAAVTNVDACETEAELAFRVNAVGARNLAAASCELAAPILHFSTDYIFDGEKGSPYIESDAPNPLGVYGKSKLEGEEHVRRHANRHYILRIQSTYGEHGKNFVTTIIKAAREKGVLTVVNDQRSSPTYTKDVCGFVSRLIEQPGYGTYHVSNSGGPSWYEFAGEIIKQTGLANVKLEPCSAKDYKRPARRPKFSVLENRNLRLCGYEPLRPFEQALADFLSRVDIERY